MDWRTDADREVCAGCSREFMQHDDCWRCVFDAKAKIYQDRWIEGGRVEYLGVDVTPAFEHPARALVVKELHDHETKSSG